MAANVLPHESGVILNAEGKVVWRHLGRGPVNRRLAMTRAYMRASCDSMAVDPPRTECGFFYLKSGSKGFPWDPYEWRAETGIAFPMDLGEVASACERCGYCPSQEIIDAGFTLDAARMVLRNFLFHGRQHEQEQRCPAAVEAVTAEPQADSSKEHPWADDAPEYLPLMEARKLIDNRFSPATLSRLCKPDGEMRYMRKPGLGCKVHIADFRRYMRGHQSDPKWAAAYMNWLQGQKVGKTRLFWKCGKCGLEYPDEAKATDRCPQCKSQSALTLKAPPKPRK
jgi:hypothetical protein